MMKHQMHIKTQCEIYTMNDLPVTDHYTCTTLFTCLQVHPVRSAKCNQVSGMDSPIGLTHLANNKYECYYIS